MENVCGYSFTIFSHELFRGSITFPTEKLPLSEKKTERQFWRKSKGQEPIYMSSLILLQNDDARLIHMTKCKLAMN